MVAQAPAILAEAAKSPLGVFALMILALSIIGFFFFREASERTRIGIFVLMFLGVASFGIAAARSAPGSGARSAAGAEPADVAGEWEARVRYPWGARHEETFRFDPSGGELAGTATYLGVPRGIVDGEVRGDRISFALRLENVDGGSYRNEYAGRVRDDEIRFTLSDSRGNPPVRFVARR